jgi:aspartate aminotransferase
MKLSAAAQSLKPSATLAMAAKAKELKARGVTVYDFSVGEPDFTTPEHICKAATDAMAAGQTHYTVASGIAELKQAICRVYERTHGLRYEPSQVVVSNGAKHSIHNVLTALCGPGDDVLIPAPFWVSYSALVELAGAHPVIVPTREENAFLLTAEELAAAVTPASRLLMLNSPSNPTGSVYKPQQLKALADVAVKRDLAVMSDEIYEKLIYGDAEFCSFPTLRDGLAERTIVVNGVSKAYAMTGWRIGWTLSPPDLAKAMGSLQSQETSNPSSISQYAALAALEGPQECVETMRREFARRRDFVVHRIAELPDVRCTEPGGAFYAFLNVSKHLGRKLGGRTVANSVDFCEAALEHAHVALVDGGSFGAEGFVRLSFATDMANLEAGLDALGKFLAGA